MKIVPLIIYGGVVAASTDVSEKKNLCIGKVRSGKDEEYFGKVLEACGVNFEQK